MSANLQLNVGLPIGSLDAYIHQVNQIPMLTAEMEYDLASRCYNSEDLEAARQLILSHLRYVVRVARGYIGYGLSLNDLIQEGNVGLIKAVKKFNPEMGVRLVSFAVHWIKAEIHDFVIKNWRIVKIATTKAQRKLFFNLRQMKKRLGWSNQEEVNSIAKDLGVNPQVVLEMEQRLNAMDAPYDGYESEDSDDIKTAPAAYLHDGRDPALLYEQLNSEEHQQEQLYEAMSKLDLRSQEILKHRFLNEDKISTLQDLAKKYSISIERVRQLEKKALSMLKISMLK